MAAKKVLLLCNSLNAGGTERNVAMICQRMDRSRYTPELWLLKGGGEFEHLVREAGVTVRNLNRGWARNPVFALRTAWRIAKSDAAIIHSFLPAITVYASLGHLIFGFDQPLIMSLGTTEMPNKFEEKLFRNYFLETLDEVLVNSASVGDYARELGCEDAGITLVPNGHSPAKYQAPLDRDQIRAELGVQPHERMLVFVGRMIPTKRVTDLITAFGDLRQRHRDLKLVLLGYGPLAGEVRDQVTVAGLNDSVRQLGFVDNVAAVLRSADMFVFPSIVEGLPNAVIEAQLAGLPIVACDIPGTRDVVTHEVTGLMTPPRDPAAFAGSVERLLTDPALARRLGEAARDSAMQNYSEDGTLEKLYAIYDRLLKVPAEEPAPVG